MHIWFDLAAREALMLLIITALGAGPASLLGRRFDGFTRVTLAPVLGLSAGICVFTSLLWVVPARSTAWLVPTLALISLGAAAWAFRRRVGRARSTQTGDTLTLTRRVGAHTRARHWHRIGVLPLPLLQLLIVGLAVAGPINYTMHQSASTGPVFYRIVDALGYVAETDGEVHQTLPQAARSLLVSKPSSKALADLSTVYWERYAGGFQEIDATPLEANLDSLVGLGAAQTQAPFLVAILVAGALGMLGALRYFFAGRHRWAPVLGAVLFGGPFFLQLFYDGSQAAIGGLALLAPLVVVGIECLRLPRMANLFLLAILLSGLVAVYPIFVPGVAMGAAVALAVMGIVKAVRGSVFSEIGSDEAGTVTVEAGLRLGEWARGRLRVAGTVLGRIALLAGMVAIFDLVAAERAVRYWNSVLHGGFLAAGLPVYDLSAAVVPGWLLQTRGFYSLGVSGQSATAVALFVIGLPAVFTLAALVASWRVPMAWVVVLLIGIVALQGVYEQMKNSCSYCEDRALLPIVPLAILLLAGAVGSLWASPHVLVKAVSPVLALAVLVSTAGALYKERQLFAATAYALPAATQLLLSRVPHGATVDLEGFNVGGMAPAEQFYTYELASEMTGRRVSLPADFAAHDALAYVGAFPLPGPQFRPGYQYILTRASAVQTGRKVVARDGALALDRREGPLSVTLDYGMVGAPLVRDDPSGRVWIDPTLNKPAQFIVAGGTSASPAFVELRFAVPTPTVAASSASMIQQSAGPGYLDVCVQATGAAPVRTADVQLTPAANVELLAMHVSGGSCSSSY